jgi:hypothetical protein
MKHAHRTWYFAALFLVIFMIPASASADFLQVYGRGHGSYLSGDQKRLSYFENNDAGLGYGFLVGAEVFQIDAFLDANFHPGGSQWNQLGLGFDMDLIPGDLIFVEPAAQLIYFFGKQEGDVDSVQGLYPRAGVQAGLEFAKVLYGGAEGWLGYAFSIPEPESGVTYMGAVFLGVRFGLF